MTDDQLKNLIGVEETMQMLQFRELIKSQMSAEEWEQNMGVHKASVKTIMDQRPGISPVGAGEIIVDMLDADTTLDDDQREVWKALVVVASFEMQEF